MQAQRGGHVGTPHTITHTHKKKTTDSTAREQIKYNTVYVVLCYTNL